MTKYCTQLSSTISYEAVNKFMILVLIDKIPIKFTFDHVVYSCFAFQNIFETKGVCVFIYL